jgi:hypothetical protein
MLTHCYCHLLCVRTVTELLPTSGASVAMLCMVLVVTQTTLSHTMYAMELCTLLLTLLSTLHGGTLTCYIEGRFDTYSVQCAVLLCTIVLRIRFSLCLEQC